MLKSLKKMISLAILIVLAISLFPIAALAANGTTSVTYDKKIINAVGNTNKYVENAIDVAVQKADTIVTNGLATMDTLNGVLAGSTQRQQASALLEAVNQLGQRLDNTVDTICNDLIENTDTKVARLIDTAAASGVEITQYYVDVTIYDQTILVDPLMFH